MNIKKALLSFFLVSVSILVLSPIIHAEDNHVAIIKNISGSVKVIRNKSELIPMPGDHLMKMDVIISGPESSAGVVFGDGTRLAIGSSAEIEISKYLFEPEKANYEFSLYLRKGEVVYSSGKIGKLAPESVSLNTPRASVGVRGTRFIIKVD